MAAKVTPEANPMRENRKSSFMINQKSSTPSGFLALRERTTFIS
jgi:hypothetical protein